MIASPVSILQGHTPLVISIPHAGTRLTQAVEDGLVPEARDTPDTDWHIPRLYEMATGLGATLVAGQYSRFVIDLNRPEDDQPLYSGATTGLYPAILFDGAPLYAAGKQPSAVERALYLEQIWRPYHQALRQAVDIARERFGYAILWDAHSIRSRLPMLFEGPLPDFNLGTFNGASCAADLAQRLESICASAEGYTHSLNGRFKGGHITRHYGKPDADIHAVQLELAQCTYMDETRPFAYREDRATSVQRVIERLLGETLTWGRERYGA